MANGDGVHHLTVHHINPISKGGKRSKENEALVPRGLHEAYHRLFENKSPDEIVIYLVNNFWNNQEEWLWVALQKLKR